MLSVSKFHCHCLTNAADKSCNPSESAMRSACCAPLRIMQCRHSAPSRVIKRGSPFCSRHPVVASSRQKPDSYEVALLSQRHDDAARFLSFTWSVIKTVDKAEAVAKTIMLSADCRKRDSIFSWLK